MVINVPLKLDIKAMGKDKKNLVPVQLNANEPVFGSVKRIITEKAEGIYECEVNVLPGMEEYVLEKMDQERRLLFPE